MNNWLVFDKSLCTDNTPKAKILFQTTQDSEDKQFDISTNKYCISCYSLYAEVCKNVAVQLNLPIDSKKHWKTEDFKVAISVLKHNISNKPPLETISKLESILISISECLKQRMKHAKTCIRPKKGVSPGTSLGDPNHDGFIFDLCDEYALLYNSYELLIKFYNGTVGNRDKFIKDKINQKYKNVLNNCYHRIRILSTEDGSKGKERSSSSLSNRNVRDRSKSTEKRISRYRAFRLAQKRSKPKKSYKI